MRIQWKGAENHSKYYNLWVIFTNSPCQKTMRNPHMKENPETPQSAMLF